MKLVIAVMAGSRNPGLHDDPEDCKRGRRVSRALLLAVQSEPASVGLPVRLRCPWQCPTELPLPDARRRV